MDLAIAALSGACVTITVAITIGLLSIRLSSSKDREADSRVSAENKSGQLAIAATSIAALTERATTAEKRLKDAEDLIDQLGSNLPVDGSYQRLFASWSRSRSVVSGTITASPAVPVESPAGTSRSGSDGLLKPGE